MSFFSDSSSFPGKASSGSLKLDVKVSSPPTLVPQRPLLIEYLALSQEILTPDFNK